MTFLPIPGKDYQDSYNRCTCNDTRSPTCIMFGSWKATNTTCTAWKPTQTSFSTDSLLLYIPRWRITRRHAATLSSWILLFAPVCIEMNANHVLVSSFLPSFLIFLFLSFVFFFLTLDIHALNILCVNLQIWIIWIARHKMRKTGQIARCYSRVIFEDYVIWIFFKNIQWKYVSIKIIFIFFIWKWKIDFEIIIFLQRINIKLFCFLDSILIESEKILKISSTLIIIQF